MSNPQWLDDLFAGVMVAVAVYSAGRLVAARVWSRPTHQDVDAAHVLMGASMSGQLVSELDVVPSGMWELVFTFLSAWFAWKCYEFVRHPGTDTAVDDHVHRLSRRLVHLIMAMAMLYMYLAAVPGRIGTGMAMGTPTGTTADFALLPMVFVLALLASAIWQVDGIGRFAPSGGTTRAVTVSVETGGPPSPEADPGTDPGAAQRWLAPRLEEAAHVVMALTMAYMLVLML